MKYKKPNGLFDLDSVVKVGKSFVVDCLAQSGGSTGTVSAKNDAMTFFSNDGTDADGFMVVPDGITRSTVTKDVPYMYVQLFQDISASTIYSVTPPEEPEKFYYIKVNNKYGITSAISLGISAPITTMSATAAQGAGTFAYMTQ